MVWSDEERERVKRDLEKYDFISVREEGSKANVEELLNKDVPIHMDPTILLDKKEWNDLIPKEKIYAGKYILYYSLGQNKEHINLVKKISKLLDYTSRKGEDIADPWYTGNFDATYRDVKEGCEALLDECLLHL